MDIVVTGANGMLAQDLIPILKESNHTVIPITKSELDITSQDELEKKLTALQFDIIINCAAYTKVDLAEKEKDLAYLINNEAVRNLVDYCSKVKCKLVHISTDYVFNGNNSIPYTETDDTDPVSVYGASKLEGEKYIQEHLEEYFIIRTSWLYGNTGKNFVKTMLYLAENKETFNVVDDQIGCPTYTEELSRAIIQLLNTQYYGIYHFSGEGQCSWYEFANTIVNEAVTHHNKIIVKEIKPIPSSEYPTDAQRPLYSVMSKEKYKKHTGQDVPHWKESLTKYFQKNLY